LSEKGSAAFDDMGGEFEARLRRMTTSTRTSRNDGQEITVSSPLAMVETRFSYKVLDRLYFPSFIAIERQVGGAGKYVVFEVVGVKPTHYQLSGVDSSMPTLLRKEYLDTIKESWGKSQETWIDLLAVPTSYMAELKDGQLEFSRAPFEPLPGSRAFILSKDAVRKFLCQENGEVIGKMAGFDLPFTADMSNLIRFHCGFFAFTGSGKSNLTASLVRKAMRRDPEMRVVVLDIAGEYAVNLLDLLEKDSLFLTTEAMDSQDEFVNSQAIPESLEDAVGRERIEAALARLYRRGVHRLSLQESGGMTLGWLDQLFEMTIDGGRSGGTAALVGRQTLSTEFFEKRRLRPSTVLSSLDADAKDKLAAMLNDMKKRLNDRTSLFGEIDLILEALATANEPKKEGGDMTPEKLAEQLAKGTAPQLSILYLPDTMAARQAAGQLIRKLVFLKKKHGNKQRILVVLDEAQEYIPSETGERNYTQASNYAVEQLLRQGRKYRVHCWLATQRVAHLNTNALQQLHSYFVSTLPRMYDRMVIAEAFALPYEVLERSAQMETGDWLFVSFKATKQRNVPVFLRTENNENTLVEYLRKAPA
jgi:Helicase HerA, central domain